MSETSQISTFSRFRVQYPVEKSLGSFEAILGPDMCEPDNTMSIPEIIARYTRGQGIAVNQYAWESGSSPEGDFPMKDSDESTFFDDPVYTGNVQDSNGEVKPDVNPDNNLDSGKESTSEKS